MVPAPSVQEMFWMFIMFVLVWERFATTEKGSRLQKKSGPKSIDV
jgi:hypothetical protein